MIKVLFICHGNICRSPMAEAVFKHLVNEAGLSDQFQIASAGVSDEEVGGRTHPRTVAVLRRHNITFEGYARQVTRTDLHNFDYVLAMDRYNLSALRRLAEGSKAEISLFLSYAKVAGTVAIEEVPDPYYDLNYDQTYDLVTKGTAAFLSYLRKQHRL